MSHQVESSFVNCPHYLALVILVQCKGCKYKSATCPRTWKEKKDENVG